MLSRNSASSRAIPVEKMLQKVEEDPFIPNHIGLNQKGMQAGEELKSMAREYAQAGWRIASQEAVKSAKYLVAGRVHKQIVNRLLEPFLWHTVIVTATDWENFFALRCHRNAEPHIAQIACMMRDAIKSSTPRPAIETSSWHLPLVVGIDYDELVNKNTGHPREIGMISAARCARVSYLTHDGKRDPQADIDLATRLKKDGHMSPFEHVAGVADPTKRYGNFRGWFQYRKAMQNEDVFVPNTEDVL
jgi:thymidylate synthase ThyX